MSSRGVYFLARLNTPKPAVILLPARTRRAAQIAELDARLAWRRPCFAVSPAGATVLVTMEDQAGSDLMLVEGFR